MENWRWKGSAQFLSFVHHTASLKGTGWAFRVYPSLLDGRPIKP